MAHVQQLLPPLVQDVTHFETVELLAVTRMISCILPSVVVNVQTSAGGAAATLYRFVHIWRCPCRTPPFWANQSLNPEVRWPRFGSCRCTLSIPSSSVSEPA